MPIQSQSFLVGSLLALSCIANYVDCYPFLSSRVRSENTLYEQCQIQMYYTKQIKTFIVGQARDWDRNLQV